MFCFAHNYSKSKIAALAHTPTHTPKCAHILAHAHTRKYITHIPHISTAHFILHNIRGKTEFLATLVVTTNLVNMD